MWRRSNEASTPKPVRWEVMKWEIRKWLEKCMYSCVIEASACHLIYLLRRSNYKVEYSKELGAASAIFCSKLYSDNYIMLNDAINHYGNKILIEYEKEISKIAFSSVFNDKKLFPLIAIHKLSQLLDLSSDLDRCDKSNIIYEAQRMIMMFIVEDVWKVNQERISNFIINSITYGNNIKPVIQFENSRKLRYRSESM